MGWLADRKARRAERAARSKAGTAAGTPAPPPSEPRSRIVTETWPADGGRPTWIYDQMRATLYTGTEDLETVGESFHQDELWATVKALGGSTRDRVRIETHAVLVPEDANPYDPNAVAVWVNGSKVGHLSRPDASVLRPGIMAAIRETQSAVVLNGVIVGGGPRDRKSVV